MHRIFLPGLHPPSGELLVTGAEAHHAGGVLRLRPGETLEILNGAGGCWRCTVVATDRRALQLRILSHSTSQSPPLAITLAIGLTKGKAFEWILQKAAELGVTRVQPLLSDHVVARPDPADYPAKRAKWRQVLVEAVKQSGNPFLPEIAAPALLDQLLVPPPAWDLALFGELAEDACWPARAMADAGAAPAACRRIWLWVGPEGDFSIHEKAALRAAGVRPVTLGPHVLRSETAALALVAVVTHQWWATRC